MGKSVLVAEGDKKVSDIFAFCLGREGYTVIPAYDEYHALQMAKERNPDLILWDLLLPASETTDVCRFLREEEITAPILICVTSGGEMEKHMESELGTYDCIVKPFSMKELLSRIKASTWHIGVTEPIRRGTSDYKMYGRLIFDFTQAAVAKDGLVLDLSPKEYELLCCLANEPGRVYTREELLGQVWNYTGFLGDVRGVDVAIRRLREKIEDDPANPAFIKTKRGMGYYFVI